MSFTRRMKYGNVVMKRSIKQNLATYALGVMNARAETWTLLGLSALVLYVMSIAIASM